MKFNTFVTFALEIEASNAKEAESLLDAQVSEMTLPANSPVNAIETTELVRAEWFRGGPTAFPPPGPLDCAFWKPNGKARLG